MCNNSLANNVILACLPAGMYTSVHTENKEQKITARTTTSSIARTQGGNIFI